MAAAFYHTVGHSIVAWRIAVLQALNGYSNLIASNFANTGYEIITSESAHSSRDPSIMNTENILLIVISFKIIF